MSVAMCSPSTTPCTFPSVPLLTRLIVFARFSVEAYYGTPSTRNLNPSPWLAIYFILICEPYRVKIGPFRSPSLAEVPLVAQASHGAVLLVKQASSIVGNPHSPAGQG